MTRKVYLDHNATTPLHPEVKKTMQKTLDMYGNPSSLHLFGRQARQLVETARQEIATFIGANADEIIFTGSGTEANNTVLSLVEDKIIIEVLTSIKRAGADIILTYFAKEMAELLK